MWIQKSQKLDTWMARDWNLGCFWFNLFVALSFERSILIWVPIAFIIGFANIELCCHGYSKIIINIPITAGLQFARQLAYHQKDILCIDLTEIGSIFYTNLLVLTKFFINSVLYQDNRLEYFFSSKLNLYVMRNQNKTSNGFWS